MLHLAYSLERFKFQMATIVHQHMKIKSTTGKNIDINYVDYSDAAGEYNEVGDSAGIQANTGSVSFDRTVYPVPFDASQYSTHWEFPNNGAHRPLDVVDESITGNTIMHIRVNDPDYDVSSTGSDTLDANTLSVKIIRGSATTGNLINSETPALDEISPTSGGIFELDLAIGSIKSMHITIRCHRHLCMMTCQFAKLNCAC